jgi:hypothetical protein
MHSHLGFSSLTKGIFCFTLLMVLSFGGMLSHARALARGLAPNKAQPGQVLPPRGLGPEFQISDTYLTGIGVDHYLPVVAYNGYRKKFLVVCHQVVASNPVIRSIYAQRVSLD